jgi:hypothetical protein
VLPEVEPGYIRPLLSETAPEEGEGWPAVMGDLERVIMPGITHWHHPQFHAYFPAANSYPALVADMLSDAISCIGFSWVREKSVEPPQSTRFWHSQYPKTGFEPGFGFLGVDNLCFDTQNHMSGRSETQGTVTCCSQGALNKNNGY